MANPTGLVNGQKVLFKIDTGSGPIVVCGETTHSATFNREVIDVTNKCSDQFRTTLDGDEGLKTLDVTLDALYSDDPAYAFLRTAWFNGAKVPAERVIGSTTTTCTVKVISIADSADGNAAVSTSFTLNSTGEFTEV